MVPGVEQSHMHAAGGLELHGLAPELGLDARLLPEAPAGRLRVARRDRRVVSASSGLKGLEAARCADEA